MASTTDTLTLTLAQVGGQIKALKQAKDAVYLNANTINDLLQTAQDSQAQLSATLEGIQIGTYSLIDQIEQTERFAAKSVCIDYIKANPTCSQDEAIAAWTTAGLAATNLPWLIQDPVVMAHLYQNNLFAEKLTPDASWESQRAWMVVTEKSIIMGLG